MLTVPRKVFRKSLRMFLSKKQIASSTVELVLGSDVRKGDTILTPGGSPIRVAFVSSVDPERVVANETSMPGSIWYDVPKEKYFTVIRPLF